MTTLTWKPAKFTHNSLIVTRTAPGQRLDEVIGEQETIEDLLPLAGKVLSKLKEMHKDNIYFGATEPRNIFIDASGSLTWIDFERTKIGRLLTTGPLTDLRRFIRRFYKDTPENIRNDSAYLPRLLSAVTNSFPLSLPFRFLLALSLSRHHKDFHFRQTYKNLAP